MTEKTCLLQQYKEIKDQIRETCLSLHRHPDEVKLVVISKFQPVQKILWLLEAGQREFGESRIEEIQEKWLPILSTYPDVRLHFIGQIQSRKIRKMVQYCHLIHSLDRIEIAKKIASECEKQNKYPECLIQINTGAEQQKGGIDPVHLPDFLQECLTIHSLHVKGLMCIPPINQDPEPHFQRMLQLKNESRLPELSMGMSNDYIKAITCGATLLRIGSKIMGTRL